jgi:ferredoxin--NADP+ reductase
MTSVQTTLVKPITGAFHREAVTGVRHWTERLFSFETTRDPGFRFSSGQFVMLGLEVDSCPLVRAYSIASPHWHNELEFYSIKVAGGPLTSRLMLLKTGDTVLVGRKPTGTLVMDGLRPGKTLYLLSTGTGLAPFLSILRDPDVYERFERIVVTHTCRSVADLSYQDLLTKGLYEDDYIGCLAKEKLLYHPTVTRELFLNPGRITDLMASGALFSDLGLPPADRVNDRMMLCGGPAFLKACKAWLAEQGFEEGSIANPGDYVVEKAFVDV